MLYRVFRLVRMIQAMALPDSQIAAAQSAMVHLLYLRLKCSQNILFWICCEFQQLNALILLFFARFRELLLFLLGILLRFFPRLVWFQ